MLVTVGDGFSIFGSHASSEVVWWCFSWGLVGGGGDVVICLACAPVFRRCEGPWRHNLGVRLRGGLLVGLRCFGIFIVGGLGCEHLIFFRGLWYLEVICVLLCV